MIDNLKIHFIRFAKSHAGVQHNLIIGYIGFLCNCNALLHIPDKIFLKIIIYGFIPVMHKAACRVVFCCICCDFRVMLKAPDIVYKVRPRLQCRKCDLPLIGIN